MSLETFIFFFSVYLLIFPSLTSSFSSFCSLSVCLVLLCLRLFLFLSSFLYCFFCSFLSDLFCISSSFSFFMLLSRFLFSCFLSLLFLFRFLLFSFSRSSCSFCSSSANLYTSSALPFVCFSYQVRDARSVFRGVKSFFLLRKQ